MKLQIDNKYEQVNFEVVVSHEINEHVIAPNKLSQNNINKVPDKSITYSCVHNSHYQIKETFLVTHSKEMHLTDILSK